mmetsp:Transcript_130303/g.363033  ORF Transcript_130303/g.363033 Transcript_130303/m.363033 type:complete len:91 (+) Transcript_130303:831-1103(+)
MPRPRQPRTHEPAQDGSGSIRSGISGGSSSSGISVGAQWKGWGPLGGLPLAPRARIEQDAAPNPHNSAKAVRLHGIAVFACQRESNRRLR